MTATEFIAACAQLASAGSVFDFDSLPGYDALASAKKAEVGFGSLSQPCSESRRTPAVSAVFSFAPPVYGGSDGEPKGSPVPAGAARSSNLSEPPPLFGSHGGGCSKPQSLEANMAQSLPAFAIGEIAVRQLDGLYSLNDLHAASGGAAKHQPALFARRAATRALVREIGASTDSQTPIRVVNDGENNGTYACRELVIAYAAWINAAFHLKVIRVFLAVAAPLPTPYTVQPSDTLTEPQQIALRALLESNVKRLPHDKQAGAMVKGWSKLKAHFGVPYRQIPASEFTEAISIVARHVAEWELVDDTPKAGTVQAIVADWVKKIESPNGYPAMLFEPIVEAVQRKIGRSQPAQADAARTKAAFDAASQAAASVQSAVFNAVLSGNDEWKYSRWVLAFIDDSAKGSPAYVRQLEHGAFTTTWPRLVRDVGTGECMCTTAELLDMAYACMQRLAQRGATAKLAA